MNPKTPPGYISAFFGAWFIGAVLCVAAMSWPTAIGILSALLIFGGAVQGIKRGIEMKVRFQAFMLAGMAGVSLLFAVASAKTKDVKAEVAKQSTTQPIQTQPAGAATEQSKPSQQHVQRNGDPSIQEQIQIQKELKAKLDNAKYAETRPATLRELQDEFDVLKGLEEKLRAEHQQRLQQAVASGNTVTEPNINAWNKFSRWFKNEINGAEKAAKELSAKYNIENIYQCVGEGAFKKVSDKTRCDLHRYSQSLFGFWTKMDNQLNGRAPASAEENAAVEDRVNHHRAEIEKTLTLLKAGKTGIEYLGK
jgi:hypothetical protein